LSAEKILNEIKNLADLKIAEQNKRFFKTGKGEYGEGDLFYGIKVPDIRKIAKKYFKIIDLSEINKLLPNPYHEARLTAIIMLVLKYQKADIAEKENIYNLYVSNVNYINSWDLVDISAAHIVGAFLHKNKPDKLLELACSKHLWSERIAMVATLYFIKQNECLYTIKLAKLFLAHKHDLMHKAAGWMLREVGKSDVNVLYAFLDEFHKSMPRTMLRYAIEKLSPEKRTFYMAKRDC